MNNTTPKWHVETLRNWNISFQLKKQNTYRNEIDNLDIESQTHETKHFSMRSFSTLHILGMTGSMLQKRTKDNFCLWTMDQEIQDLDHWIEFNKYG
jgi:hypothetical protein